jgi:hypothetical protein
VNLPDKNGNTPLHFLSCCTLASDIISHQAVVKLIKSLMEAGANPETKNDTEMTPTMLANARANTTLASALQEVLDELKSTQKMIRLEPIDGRNDVPTSMTSRVYRGVFSNDGFKSAREVAIKEIPIALSQFQATSDREVNIMYKVNSMIRGTLNE